MNEKQSNWLQAISQICTVSIALAALFVAIFTEFRSERRFQAQIEQADKIAKAHIRPLLSVYYIKRPNI